MITRKNHAIYKPNTLLSTVANEVKNQYQSEIVAAKLDNIITDLQTPVGNYETIDFIEVTSIIGTRIYQHSVVFILIVALRELYPQAELFVRFSAKRGLYCDLEIDGGVTKEIVFTLEQKMREIVSQNIPIIKKSLPYEYKLKHFKKMTSFFHPNFFTNLNPKFINIYTCGNVTDYFLGTMLNSTGNLGTFELDYSSPGLLLRTPTPGKEFVIPPKLEQKTLTGILSESKKWANILECNYVSDLNRIIKNGYGGELINVSEALHDKKIVEIAEKITREITTRRIILVAGPSSSGKTSFAQRLKIQLLVNNIRAYSISMDDYYLDRHLTPLTPEGTYDYESINALDITLFNKHLNDLLIGKEIMVPHYNFSTGMRDFSHGQTISLGKNEAIIIEGIHGLNEQLTSSIARNNKFKIYISALTPLNIDKHTRIHTSDNRLIRRIIRDFKYRGASATKTLKQWENVRLGEEKNIFPFQEDADIFFNSALLYEIAVLKKHILPILEKISQNDSMYPVTKLLLEFFPYFESIDDESDIPSNSLIKEFVGGSCFFDNSGKLKVWC